MAESRELYKVELGAYALAATPGIPLLTARGAGLLNTNNIARLGYGWRGGAMDGEQIFRLGIGRTGQNQAWWHIDLLPLTF